MSRLTSLSALARVLVPVAIALLPVPRSDASARTPPATRTSAASAHASVAADLVALNDPTSLAIAPDGSLYIGDRGNNRVLRRGTDGTVRTVVGNGMAGMGGDGGPATQAQLDGPSGIAVGPDGSLYVADATYGNGRVRQVDAVGVITTVIGMAPDVPVSTLGGTSYNCPADSYLDFDSGPIPSLQLCLNSSGVAAGPDGSVYVADITPGHILRATPDGLVRRVAAGSLRGPTNIAVSADGSLYIADTAAGLVCRVGPDGAISTVAGGGNDTSGASVPGTHAALNGPSGLSLAPDGSLYIAESGAHRVRRLAPDGTITTVAGTGVAGTAGDGGPATQAQLNGPNGLAVADDGSLYIADAGNNLIRRVGPDGLITTILPVPAIPPASATPTATPTLTPTATPTLTPTATPTLTPTATPTLTPTATPTLTPTTTPTATLTVVPTVAARATPTAAPSSSPTATATPSAVPARLLVSPDPLTARSSWVRRLLDEGATAYDRRAYRSALALENAALRLEPRNAFAYSARGRARLALRDARGAVRDQTLALHYHPGSARYYLRRGQAYQDLNDVARALADDTTAIRLFPTYLQAYILRGDLYRTRGNDGAAIADETAAIRLFPQEADAYLGRARARAHRGDKTEAVSDTQQALHLYAHQGNRRGVARAQALLRTLTLGTT